VIVLASMSILLLDGQSTRQQSLTWTGRLSFANAEEARQDQREDESPARAHTSLQQGSNRH
jgi:hypothetical protein